jgi:hypothetical protein
MKFPCFHFFSCNAPKLLVINFFWKQGAIMAVGSSQPTVVGTKDGRIGMKNQMQVK